MDYLVITSTHSILSCIGVLVVVKVATTKVVMLHLAFCIPIYQFLQKEDDATEYGPHVGYFAVTPSWCAHFLMAAILQHLTEILRLTLLTPYKPQTRDLEYTNDKVEEKDLDSTVHFLGPFLDYGQLVFV